MSFTTSTVQTRVRGTFFHVRAHRNVGEVLILDTPASFPPPISGRWPHVYCTIHTRNRREAEKLARRMARGLRRRMSHRQAQGWFRQAPGTRPMPPARAWAAEEYGAWKWEQESLHESAYQRALRQRFEAIQETDHYDMTLDDEAPE